MLDFEQKFLIDCLEQHATKTSEILDVACGFGAKLSLLKKYGYSPIGYDINENTVLACKQKGLPAINKDEFDKLEKVNKFDIIIMSHIIEHFSPNDLFKFMEEHLRYLKKGGLLIIFTPLHSSHFYDDFDHVRPYPPAAIINVFCQNNLQVQYKTTHCLNLVNLKFRKAPIAFHFWEENEKHIKLFNLIMKKLFLITRGFIGKKDGWAAVFNLR